MNILKIITGVYILAIIPFITFGQTQRLVYEDFEYTSLQEFINSSSSWSFINLVKTDSSKFQLNSSDVFSYKETAIVSNPIARSGNKSLMVSLNKIPSQLYLDYRNIKRIKNIMNRIELSSFVSRQNRNLVLNNNTKYSFEYSVYLPIDSFELENSFEASKDIVGQWHQLSSKPSPPPLSIQIRGTNWYLVIVSDGSAENANIIDLGKVNRNVWIDWKIEVTFSTNDKGKIVVNKNNEIVCSIEGKNRNDDRKLYFKVGLYKPDWWAKTQSKATFRRFYIDRVIINEIFE